jgi:hypothetical protein
MQMAAFDLHKELQDDEELADTLRRIAARGVVLSDDDE